jgi:protein phosphatase
VLAADWGAASDRGKVRKVNEDSLLAEPPVFVVADGMGGHAAGDVASRIAVAQFEELAGTDRLSAAEAMAAVGRANEAILSAAQEDGAKAGMGTTLAGLLIVMAAGAEHWMAINVGDCRVYRLRGGELRQVTIDHSEAEELVAAGRMTREEARGYGRRNIVTRSVGTEPPPVVDSWMFPPEDGDRFIICSDGLTTEVVDAEIASTAAEIQDPQELAEKLVDRAVAAGGRDNVTVIVVNGPSATRGSVADENTAPRPGQPPS